MEEFLPQKRTRKFITRELIKIDISNIPESEFKTIIRILAELEKP